MRQHQRRSMDRPYNLHSASRRAQRGAVRLIAHRAMLAALAATLLAVLLTVPTGPASAQGGGFELPPGVTWDDVNDIAHKMYCDVCEGVPLDECESVACRQWREEIARQLGEGRSEDQIVDYFVERYGADVAAVPRDTLDRVLTFGVPLLAVVVFGALGALQMRRMRQQGQQAGQPVRRSGTRRGARPVPDDVDPYYIDRLEHELEGLES